MGSFALDADIPNPIEVAFGFGRRRCPGRYMAYESIWLIITSILATFKIEISTDAAGRPIIPDEAHTCGFVV